MQTRSNENQTICLLSSKFVVKDIVSGIGSGFSQFSYLLMKPLWSASIVPYSSLCFQLE